MQKLTCLMIFLLGTTLLFCAPAQAETKRELALRVFNERVNYMRDLYYGRRKYMDNKEKRLRVLRDVRRKAETKRIEARIEPLATRVDYAREHNRAR